MIASTSTKLRPPGMMSYGLLALLLPALLVGFGMWLDGEYRRVQETGALVEAIADRRIIALDLLSSLRQAETAQRGFVITGNTIFLQPYEPSRAVIARNVDTLTRDVAATAGVPRDRGKRLIRLIDAKFREMDAVLAMVHAGRREDALARVSDGEGQRLMARIDGEMQGLIAADAASLAEGQSRFWQRTYRSQQVVWMLIWSTGALLASGLLVLWRARRERWRVMVAEADASLRNRAILDSTSDAIIILNPSGTIESVNAAARTVLGYEPEELSRRDVSVVLDIADGEGSFHERIGLVEGRLRRTLFIDHQARTKDGRLVPVDVALGLMPLPDGLHIVASVRDISSRREIERLKDDFIATVSHELRTPLTSVIGSLGLLRVGAAGTLPASAAELVAIAEKNARRLTRLTDDILDLEKFGTGQMSLALAPTDLVAIVQQAIAESEGLARAKAATLAFSASAPVCPVIVDHERLLQVVTNLLSNAIRHTPAGSTVTITTATAGEHAISRICDQGSGVPGAYREQIFDRFVQAPSSGAIGGTGLGLAIAREIIHRHGGRIWVEDAEGGGACFAFTLPLRHEGPAARGGDTAPVPNLAAASGLGAAPLPTVLQVDDDVDLVQVVAASLKGAARVLRADGLASARAVLASERPDVVILDIGLPDGSGCELLPSLVTRAGKPIPTIIFSAQQSLVPLNGQVEAILVKSASALPMLRSAIGQALARRTAP